MRTGPCTSTGPHATSRTVRRWVLLAACPPGSPLFAPRDSHGATGRCVPTIASVPRALGRPESIAGQQHHCPGRRTATMPGTARVPVLREPGIRVTSSTLTHTCQRRSAASAPRCPPTSAKEASRRWGRSGHISGRLGMLTDGADGRRRVVTSASSSPSAAPTVALRFPNPNSVVAYR
jgi:hypothetical protein